MTEAGPGAYCTQAWDGSRNGCRYLRLANAKAEFLCVAVVIDKVELRNDYGDAAAHPYHIGLSFLLQRYAGYLIHISRRGDVMGESRGGTEDRLLKYS